MKTSTAFIRHLFANPSLDPGRPGLYSRNHFFQPFYDVEGDGGGGDTGGGDGGDVGDGGDGTGNQGSALAYDFGTADPNATFKFPGTDKPMTVAAYQEHLKSQTTSAAKAQAGQAIMALIENARKGRRPGQQGQQGQQQQLQRRASDKTPDPLAEIEKMDLVDGKSIANLLRGVGQGQLAPMTKLIQDLANEVKGIKAGVTTIQQAREEGQFGDFIGKAVKTLKLPTVKGKELDASAFSDVVRDLYLSYDDDQRPHLVGDEFNKMVKAKFDSLRKFFKSYDEADLAAARERQMKRIYPGKGANTSLNGASKKPMSNRQIADILFDGKAPNT